MKNISSLLNAHRTCLYMHVFVLRDLAAIQEIDGTCLYHIAVYSVCTQYPDMMHGIDKIHVVLNNLKYAISFILLIRKQR